MLTRPILAPHLLHSDGACMLHVTWLLRAYSCACPPWCHNSPTQFSPAFPFPAMASSLFRLSSHRSALMRTGLLGLLVPICSLPAGQAQAATFTRNPVVDDWTFVGSTDQGPNPGAPQPAGWSGNGNTFDFDVYNTSFILGSSDNVTGPANGTARGDAYLLGNSPETCPSGAACNVGTSWLVGDKIMGFGVKVRDTAGPTLGIASPGLFFNIQPNPKAGYGWTFGTEATTTPGQNAFDSASGQSGASQGAIAVEIVTNGNAANRGPYGSYTVKSNGDGSAGFNTTPYGLVNGNTNCVSTIANPSICTPLTPTAVLPVRAFGNIAQGQTASSGLWNYYELFLNTSLMELNGKGEGTFSNNAQFSITANRSNIYATVTGGIQPSPLWAPPAPPAPAPGPLPLLGAGVALGWSRRLRRQLRATAGGLKITT